MDGSTISEAATKNKRGRPPTFTPAYYDIWNDMEKRTAQNMYYVGITVMDILNIQRGEETFFTTANGRFKQQGIAEQIGRMYAAGLLNKDQCKELAETVIEEYQQGTPAKEIQRQLRRFKKHMEGGEPCKY